MRGRVVVLGELSGREAAALIVDGRLEDLLIEPPEDAGPGLGAILRAVADRPMKGQGAMFVALPGGATGYLRETGGIAPGAAVIVQVTGHAEPGKAIPVTRRVLFKGRHAIVTPDAPGRNISRRIRDDEARARLAALAEAGMAGSAFGLILRSAAADAASDDVAGEIASLRALAEEIMRDATGGPELLLDAPSPHEEAWRDWADPAPDEVLSDPGAIETQGVPAMVAALRSAQVRLAGGGHMAIEPTRALIAVDVNTGGDTSPAAGLKANIAAVRELARQLRLRGLGGQVTVDFAPMPKKDRAALEQQMRTAFKGEAAETVLAGWTPLGNYELQRKRDRLPLSETLKGLSL